MSDTDSGIGGSRSRPWKFGTRILVAYGVFIVLLLGVVLVQGALAPERQSGALASPAPAAWTAAAEIVANVTVYEHSYGCNVRVSGISSTEPASTFMAQYFDPDNDEIRIAYGALVSTAFPCTPQPAPSPTSTPMIFDLSQQ